MDPKLAQEVLTLVDTKLAPLQEEIQSLRTSASMNSGTSPNGTASPLADHPHGLCPAADCLECGPGRVLFAQAVRHDTFVKLGQAFSNLGMDAEADRVSAEFDKVEAGNPTKFAGLVITP